MEYGAIDLHKQRSVIRIVTADGQVTVARTIPTSRDAFATLFSGRARMRVLVESGTESEWVAQTVEGCGHEVVVADPNYTLMYGARSRRLKTDRRDVFALAEACRLGVFRPAHRVSAAQRDVRRRLRVRAQLVRMRTQAINLLRAQLRQEGYRLGSGSAKATVQRYRRLTVPSALTSALEPILDVLRHLEPTLKALDAATRTAAQADAICRHLMSAPGVGPVIALGYRSTLDTVERFTDAGAVTAFLGLVPSQDSSGSRRRVGAITKAGPPMMRTLLIQAAGLVWRLRYAMDPLHRWVHAVAARRGRRVAIVGLARRLARVLYALWRDGADYRLIAAA
jgi:transposase